MAVLFLAMLRPPSDRQALPTAGRQAGSPAAVSADRQPRDASAAEARDSPDPGSVQRDPAGQREVTSLRAELEKSSQENTTLRATIEELRAELAALKGGGGSQAREQGGPEPAAEPKYPAEGEAGQNEAARDENQQADEAAKTPAAATAPPIPKPVAPAPPIAAPHVAGPAKPPASEPHPKSNKQAKILENPNSTRDYLAVAREHLKSGSVDDATDALERAETRALNESRSAKDPTVELITQARTELRSGNKANALKTIGAVLQKPQGTAAAGKQSTP